MASASEELTLLTPQSFEQYYANKNGLMYNADKYDALSNPNSFINRFGNFFTGKVTSAKQEYDNYLAQVEAHNNAYYAQEANKKTWAREDSQMQRARADYEAAGFSPYALINSGSGALTSSQAQAGSYKRASNKEEVDNKMASTALRILALIVLKKAL